MYVKVFSTILDSSVWSESHATRIVWITALAMADAEGYVQASPAGFARRACVSREELDAALEVLGAPDADSQSPDDEGRRMVQEGPGLWRIVNYRRYREIQTPEQQRSAVRSREYRARKKRDASHTPVTRHSRQRQRQKQKQKQKHQTSGESSPPLPDVDSRDATTVSAAPRQAACATPPPVPLDPVVMDFPRRGGKPPWTLHRSQIADWSSAYTVDVEAECRKARAWLEANPSRGKVDVKRFLVNWLNRAQDRGSGARARASPVETRDEMFQRLIREARAAEEGSRASP